MTDLARLRSLAEAATPGPWQSLVHGTASQRDAAGRAYEAVMAVHAPDSPDIQFTDLSWVDQGDDGPHVALIGNGPNGPENAHYIAALHPQTVLNLLDAAALVGLREALDAHEWGTGEDDWHICSCGWMPPHPPDSRDERDWQDHREQAVRAALSTGGKP